MQIGKPAYNHGIAESDIWHGVRNAVRKIHIDEELTMLIGPTSGTKIRELPDHGRAADDVVSDTGVDLLLPRRAGGRP